MIDKAETHKPEEEWKLLRHDFHSKVHFWPHNQPGLLEHIDEIKKHLNQRLIETPHLLTLQQLCQNPTASKASIVEAFGDLIQHLFPEQAPSLSIHQILGVVESLRIHWKAAIQDIQQFLTLIQHETSTALGQELTEALHKRSSENYKVAGYMTEIAKQVNAILSDKYQSHQHDPAFMLAENSLKQHLPIAERLYTQHQADIKAYLAHPGRVKLADLDQIISDLQQRVETQDRYAIALPESHLPLSLNADSRTLLILEDDPDWQQEMRRVVQRSLNKYHSLLYAAETHSRDQLFRRWQIKVVGSIAEAEALLAETALLISDLSVPLQPGGTARREHGVKFLKSKVRTYARNIPVIIHSSTLNDLDSQTELKSAGIADINLLYKAHSAELETRVLDYLLQMRLHELEVPLPVLSFHAGAYVLEGVQLKLSSQLTHLMDLFVQAPTHHGLGLELSTDQMYSALYPEKSISALTQDHSARRQAELLQALEIPQSKQQAVASALYRLSQVWNSYLYQKSDPYDPAENLSYRWNRFLESDSTASRCVLTLQDAVANFDERVISQATNYLFAQSDTQPTPYEKRELFPRLLLRDDFLEMLAKRRAINADISKLINRLKTTIHDCFSQVGQSLQANQLFKLVRQELDLGNQSPVYRLKVQRGENLIPNQPPETTRVLIVEDDLDWAQDMQLSIKHVFGNLNQRVETRHISYLEQTEAVLDNWVPDIVLLDLNLPLAGDRNQADLQTADDTGGYQVWDRIRARGNHPGVIVTSSLVNHSDLRRLGLQYDLDSRIYLNKGGDYMGYQWPESLQAKLRHLLKERAALAILPEIDTPSLLPDIKPISVEVLYYGPARTKGNLKSKKFELELKVWAEFNGEIYLKPAATIKSVQVTMLSCLLANAPELVPVSHLKPILAAQTEKQVSEMLHNYPVRIRNQIIDATWPVAWMELDKPGIEILKQLTINNEMHFGLLIREVKDPKGYLNGLRRLSSSIKT